MRLSDAPEHRDVSQCHAMPLRYARPQNVTSNYVILVVVVVVVMVVLLLSGLQARHPCSRCHPAMLWCRCSARAGLEWCLPALTANGTWSSS
jgi:hypothetical protein